MRVVAAALILGLLLAALPPMREPRGAHACSFVITSADLQEVLDVMAGADLVVSGLVVDEVELAQDPEASNPSYSRVTIRVDHVLKGEYTEQLLVIENDTAPCNDIGPQLRQGDDVFVSLLWNPTWTHYGQPMDHRWMMPRVASTVRFVKGTPYAIEASADTPPLHLGNRDDFMRAVGNRLGLPESEVDALVAEKTDIDGPAARWTLALELALVLSLLAAAGVVVRERRSRRA